MVSYCGMPLSVGVWLPPAVELYGYTDTTTIITKEKPMIGEHKEREG